MNAAWHAWAEWGRPRHPRLRVGFATPAGLAPLGEAALHALSVANPERVL